MGKTKRNDDIIKSYKKEIDLKTKSVKSKKDYQRKPKPKKTVTIEKWLCKEDTGAL